MAKQLVNPLERHAEKAVLGVCGLVLLGVVAKYLVTTPNQEDFGGEIVTPATMDTKLAQKADEVRARCAKEKPKIEKPAPPPKFETTLVFGPLPPSAPFLPIVPIVDERAVNQGEASLPKVVDVGVPAITRGRSTIELPPDWPGYAELGGRTAVDWVSVAVLFDRKTQAERNASQLGDLKSEVLFTGVELERRAQRADGTWSDDDWKPIDAWPRGKSLPPPEVPLFDDDGKLQIKAADHVAITRFRDELADPKLQLEIIRPLMRTTKNGDLWNFPRVDKVSERDVLNQDDEYLFPNQPLSANPTSRYPFIKSEGSSGLPTTKDKITELTEKLKIATANCMEDAAKEVQTAAMAIVDNPEAAGGEKTAARKLAADAKSLLDNIKAKTCQKKSGSADTKKRDLSPVQLIWANDARPGSLEPGKSYQYRIRPLLYNNRTGEPDQFRERADARTVVLTGEWSSPTAAITIDPFTMYFLAGSNREKGTASFDMFQWFGGAWVKPRSPRVDWDAGKRIQIRSKADAPDPDNPLLAIQPEVTFDALSTIADIDFDRPLRERKKSGKSGLKFDRTTTVTVLIVNDKGELEERFEAVDRASPVKARLKVFKPGKEQP